MNKQLITVERLIGKIDNDFNPTDNDWIPRVGAWVIDALSQLKCLPMEIKHRKVKVEDRLAIFDCPINKDGLKVYDKNGCEIPELKKYSCGCNSQNYIEESIAITNNDKDINNRHIVLNIINPKGRNYIITGCNKIELNFDTDFIEIESFEVITYYSDTYNCYLPFVVDDGKLLEALSYYCMYKMLTRGLKHPVFSLSGPESVNPYIQWTINKSNAAASAKIALQEYNGKGWNNFFYNSTFLPRG